jgi:cytochrome c-type biogenesis protein CcmH/NrfF
MEGVVISRGRIRRWAGLLLVASLAVTLSGGPAVGQRVQDRPNAEEADRAIDLLRSPYCPGFMLRVCTSSQAAALRDSIYDLAAQGMTSDELVEWMVGRHGEEWRAMPRRSGTGLLAWIIPPLAVLFAVGGVMLWLKKHRGPAGVAPAEEGDALTEADRLELTAALRDWEASGGEDV